MKLLQALCAGMCVSRADWKKKKNAHIWNFLLLKPRRHLRAPALLTTLSTDPGTARVALATIVAEAANHCLSVLRRVASRAPSPLEYKLVSLYLILELNDGQIVLLRRPRKLRSSLSDSPFFS